MTDWTPTMVDERLVEAAVVLRRLPMPRARGYFNVWPRMVVEFSDLAGQTPEPMRRTNARHVKSNPIGETFLSETNESETAAMTPCSMASVFDFWARGQRSRGRPT